MKWFSPAESAIENQDHIPHSFSISYYILRRSRKFLSDFSSIVRNQGCLRPYLAAAAVGTALPAEFWAFEISPDATECSKLILMIWPVTIMVSNLLCNTAAVLSRNEFFIAGVNLLITDSHVLQEWLTKNRTRDQRPRRPRSHFRHPSKEYGGTV